MTIWSWKLSFEEGVKFITKLIPVEAEDRNQAWKKMHAIISEKKYTNYGLSLSQAEGEGFIPTFDALKLSSEFRKRIEELYPYKGRIVVLNTGKYKGREAVIDGILPDCYEGVLFLCMVLRKDRSEMLNSDAESRSYRHQYEFTLKGEETWLKTK